MKPSPARAPTSTPLASWGVFLLCLSTAAYRIVSHIHANSDLLSHLAFGRFVVDHRAIPMIDTLASTTTGLPWINHEWLSQVIAYLAFARSPYPSISLITLTILLPACASYTLLYRRCWQHHLALPTTAGLLFIVILLTALPFSSGRPYVYTFFLLTLLLQILLTYESRRTPTLWTIPPLMALWANLHPGVAIGLALLVLWAGCHLLLPRLPRIQQNSPHLALPAQPILLLIAASTLATLVTLYGWRLWHHLLISSSLKFDYLAEWTPITLRSVVGVSYVAFAFAASAVYFSSPLRRSPVHTTLLIALLPLPFLAMRHLPISVLLIASLAIPHLAAYLSTRATVQYHLSDRRVAITSFALAATLLTATLRHPSLHCLGYPPVFTKAPYPVRAVSLLQISRAAGTIALPFDWSPPVLWSLYPRIRPSADIRRDWPTGIDALRLQLRFEQGIAGWDALLKSADLALVKRKSPTEQLLLLTPTWRLLYQDSLASLFTPRNGPLVSRLGRISPPDIPDDGAGHCVTLNAI